jgi:hypothetical protein
VRFERFQQVGCGLDIVRRGLLGAKNFSSLQIS